MQNKWQVRADSLLRLAEDQAGKPEGDVARQKLKQLLQDHPRAREYKHLQQFMMGDLKQMKQKGISTDGSWTGRNLEEAVAKMIDEYNQRLAGWTPPTRRIADGSISRT